jgi:hypothetical protein
MESSKYIIIKIGETETAILFSSLISHIEIANKVSDDIISAGFFEVAALPTEKDSNNIEVGVFGRSITLNKTARKGIDEKIIKEILRKTYD